MFSASFENSNNILYLVCSNKVLSVECRERDGSSKTECIRMEGKSCSGVKPLNEGQFIYG